MYKPFDKTEGEHAEIARGLLAVDQAGQALFSPEDLESIIPILVMSSAAQGASVEFPPRVIQVFERFLEQVGVLEQDGAEQLARKLDAHYAAYPVRRDLLLVAERLLRVLVAWGGPGANRRVLLAIGADPDVTPIVGTRPPGTTPAGPLARFALIDHARKDGRARSK